MYIARTVPCFLLSAARLAEADLQCTLAVSIHAGNQALRERLIPRCGRFLPRGRMQMVQIVLALHLRFLLPSLQ